MRIQTPAWLVAGALALALAGAAAAGEVYVNVGSPLNKFNPQTAGILNNGDFVIWTWLSGFHTVTSGTDGSGAGDGNFNSDPSGTTTHAPGAIFAWKTGINTVYPYYCYVHFVFNMKGTIVVDPNAQEADFRITEVRFDGTGSNFIEIANLGDAAGDLNQFRVSINGSPALTPWTTSTIVPASGRIVINNPAGLASQGSVALYIPYLAGSAGGTGALTDASMMVDYVEWGAAAGQPLEATALATLDPTVWNLGGFAPLAKPGHSIVFCGRRFEYGSGSWNESINPTPGAPNDCVNPTLPSTWGRLKSLYR